VPKSISGVGLDLEIVTRRPFVIASNQADVSLEGRLRIIGSQQRPVVAGEVRAARGDFYYLSRRFRIAEGSVIFTGSEGFDPFIVLSAVTEVGKTTIFLNTQSNLSSLTLNLSSTPPYGREDIIALLTFGQTVTGLKGKGEAASAMAAASIVGGELLGRIQEETRRTLSLSVFQIDPEVSETTGDTDLRFTLGKKVSDRLFLSWSQRLTGSERQAFTAEYRILDFLTITGERDSDGQNHFDLKVDFGF
jgi:autotransporter translocation and assembly factor TamB